MTKAAGGGSNGWPPQIWWLAAAIGLPIAVGGAWYQLPTRHPVIAVLLLFAYWVALAVARFAGAVASQLSERWSNRLAERIDRVSVQRFSRLGRRYNDYVLSSLRFIDQKGLPTVGFYTPELDEVFVNVSLAKRPRMKRPLIRWRIFPRI